MFCTSCGQRNEEGASYCQSCGEPMKGGKPKKSKAKQTVIGIVCGVVISAAGAGGYYFWNEQEEEKALVTSQQDAKAEAEAADAEKEEAETPEDSLAEASKQISPKEKDKTAVIKESQQRVYTILTAESIGSGFLFTESGAVVTNAHVVAGYTDVMVRNSNGQEYSGTVIGISDVSDIALIQVDAFKGLEPLAGEMESTDVGTEIIALGSPNGFENTASIGYLTGVDRNFTNYFTYDNIYQVDAQIAGGSSGGPLLDASSGKVIGINSLLYDDGMPIGFSIPLYSVHGQLMSWVDAPMSATQVASVFGVYEDYEYVEETWDAWEDESVEDTWDEWEEYEEDAGGNWAFDEHALSEFLGEYRYWYEIALTSEDFYYIEDMLLPGSAIYTGISDYIDEISGQGMLYSFTDLEIEVIEIFDDHALVHTYEAFEFVNAAGEWSLEERSKTYTIVLDEWGYYLVSAIVSQE